MQIPQIIKTYVSTNPVAVGIGLAVTGLLLVAAVFGLASTVHEYRYHKKESALMAERDAAVKKSQESAMAATEANAKAVDLEKQLSGATEKIKQLQEEASRTGSAAAATRKVYYEKRVPVSVPVYITGDASRDSIELCKRLGAAGFPCK